ncbi:Bulb-type lectin domain [Arabidopsis thaliana x Arabidopsis arenosa]|uniref:Receptor-like serine/threonine-protein kinase n=2 Tax=Arabidopsis TaxID=3701 RepID=A0A8T1XZ34_9BRAS|nr:Bulb-type lectin domain [Arabidopsis thaliana x Arabidopsis arenosa]
MTRSMPHGNHFYTSFFFLVFQLVVLIPSIASYDSTFSPTRPLRITENETIVSPEGIFELGFFKPATRFQERDRWYLGIWYKRFTTRVVWVANRDDPLSSSIGTLKVDNSNIVLLDHSGRVAWTTSLTKNMINNQLLVAELLDNGNFVLRFSNSSSYLWQSFDFPTDTLLPGMKLGWDRRTNHTKSLISWKSLDDPSSGRYVYKIDTLKPSQGLIFGDDLLVSRPGPTYRKLFNITETDNEITHSLGISTANVSLLTLSFLGSLKLMAWTGEWNVVWHFPRNFCDYYGECGQNSYCKIVNKKTNCNCIQGFQGDQHAWDLLDSTNRCLRKTQLSCDSKAEFKQLKKMDFPDTKTSIVDTTVGSEECRKSCLTNCNCTAFANTEWGCVRWTSDLIDLRSYNTEGVDLYIKLATADLGVNKKTIIGSIVGGCLLLVLSFIILCLWIRRKKRARAIAAANVSQERNRDLTINTTEDWGSKRMDFDVISTATNHFSELNKLGKGGFGIVYKGRLCDGQEIAVKRLSKMSPIGVDGFAVEAKLIALVQHINVIRLIGFCYNADEKILVYEFLENSSLDTYLFDSTRGSVLNWDTRFDIAKGIVRGLVYLHQDSRFRIVHLDLKPSNILLDKDMVPKISDFGMARILGGDETEAHVTTVTGTFGYIAPEYRSDGVLSVKSDVFSFGVMLLEIISGKRNIDFLHLNDGSTLLSYMWNHWSQGNGLEIVDHAIKDSSSSSQQILRCVQIGLMCVQELPEDRPTMSSVGLMLGRETEAIPQPKSPVETGSSSRGQQESESGTVPEMTLLIEGR